jgi:hypothetical protein
VVSDQGQTKRTDLAVRIGQLTAAVGALATLVAAVAALIIAVDKGLDQVGPTFAKWARHATAQPQPPPQPASACVARRAEFTAALGDLTSSVTPVRRGARSRLAQELAQECPQRIDALIAGLPTQTYQVQVGVAVALAGVPGGWKGQDTAASVATLRRLAATTGDATLRQSLSRAIEAARP